MAPPGPTIATLTLGWKLQQVPFLASLVVAALVSAQSSVTCKSCLKPVRHHQGCYAMPRKLWENDGEIRHPFPGHKCQSRRLELECDGIGSSRLRLHD